MGNLMIIIILDRFNRFIGSKALSRLDFPKMRFCRPYEFAIRIVKHMTAFFIGIVAMMLALIGTAFLQTSDAVYRFGDCTLSDKQPSES
jgi:hypothetical protein